MFDELIGNIKKLEKAHNFYVGANEADRERIYQACDREGGLFDKLEQPAVWGDGRYSGSGFDRSFGTLFLLYGIEFLKSEYKVDILEEFIALLLDGKVLY
jgi:hypothetical protein